MGRLLESAARGREYCWCCVVCRLMLLPKKDKEGWMHPDCPECGRLASWRDSTLARDTHLWGILTRG